MFHDKIPSLLGAPLLKSPLDGYALGYCISNSTTRIPWKVTLSRYVDAYFISGLKNNKCSGGAACIKDLTFDRSVDSDFHFDEWKVLFVLDALVSLRFYSCHLDYSSQSHLLELIPLMTNLQEFQIVEDNLNEDNNYWIKVLHHLSMTNVRTLSFGWFRDDLAPNLYDHYCSALRRLIHPCTGKLEKLYISTRTCDDRLMRLLSSESSLKSLTVNLERHHKSVPFPITYFTHPLKLSINDTTHGDGGGISFLTSPTGPLYPLMLFNYNN